MGAFDFMPVYMASMINNRKASSICPRCKGEGYIRKNFLVVNPCRECGGTGYKIS